jgi:SsrA-binding protein
MAKRAAAAPPDRDAGEERQLVAQHRRARFEYHILSTVEAGLVLTGTEVKALREGKANLTDSFGVVNAGELFVLNLHIGHYGLGNQFNHEPTRTRKLLLHKKEIRRLIGAVEREGATLVPLDLYFRRGHAKLTLALAKGKKLHDKREDLRKKDAEREIARAVRRG